MYKVYKNLCEEKGVTSYAVAKATGISQATLSDWKRGRSTPKVEKLIKIAKFFGVEVSTFVGGAS